MLDSRIDVVTQLFNQSSVIITSRPDAGFPASRTLDLELKTVGFDPDQVKDDIETAFIIPETSKTDQKTVDKIHSFVEIRRFVSILSKSPDYARGTLLHVDGSG